MAIKKRFVECECGEIFHEGMGNQLEGNVVYGPWRLRGNRQRATKTPNNCDILVALFFRTVLCGKCKQEIVREQKQYELTPPFNPGDEPYTMLSNREYVMSKSTSDSTVDLQANEEGDDEEIEDVATMEFGPAKKN